MPPTWTKTTPWIWTPDPSYSETNPATPAQFVLFRKSFTLPSSPRPEQIPIHVSADTRYRLYINGTSVSFGPAKSYLNEWNYETVDIAPFVRPGKNVLAVRVLRYSGVQVGNTSMVRAGIPGFILHEEGDIGLSTSTPWLCKLDKSVRILAASEWNRALGPPFLCLNEEVDGEKEERGWLDADFDDAHWDVAVKSSLTVPMLPIHEPWRLVPRSIPHLPEIEGRFSGVVKAEPPSEAEAWKGLICKDQPVTVSANSTTTVILANETLVTAFLRFHFRGGAESKITIRCAECFEYPPADGNPNPFARNKGNRTDPSGILMGPDDSYTLPTTGTTVTYEPFWHRTFRYIQLTITTASTPLIFTNTTYRTTHYPLSITTSLPLPYLPPLESAKWRTSLHTLQLCMQETYTDCPFYEQNQFALDSRLQALFSYNLSRDDRLARKTIHEFHASRRQSDGLIETHFPTPFPGLNIPVFSLYWILMVHDHMLYFGDKALVKRYIGAIDGILDYFESRVDERYGMVGAFDNDAWAFVDWTKEWSVISPGGDFRDLAVPPGYRRTGVVAYASLVYAFALKKAGEMCDFLERRDVAREYRDRAQQLNSSVLKHCLRRGEGGEEVRGEIEFLTDAPDSPDADELSQHTQVFAILSGAITGLRAKQILHRALSPSTKSAYAQCSYAMSFYVFEAAVQVGLYDEFRADLVRPWTQMLEMNLSTWAESAAMPRSDCHGWSCVPIYDAVVNVLGIRPVSPGCGRLRFEPRRGCWDHDQEGQGGEEEVRVSWDKRKGKEVRFWVGFDAEVEVRDGEEGYKVVQVKQGETLTVEG
ncbi:Six-hairpin glycosidase-like protein [Aspergillus granulosus]|uniref:Six-hairpin glycosidase-like protein n=1 Tax=Aspergillus granulosus TaxID=176169 RepID=A0ABR4H1N0_9EURO